MRGPFPDLHRAISIFQIQFAGAVMRGPFPDLQTAISIFKIQFAVVTTTSTYPKGAAIMRTFLVYTFAEFGIEATIAWK